MFIHYGLFGVSMRKKINNVDTVQRIEPRTESQRNMLKALNTSTLIIANGFAGVGKTYLACRYAADLLSKNRTGRIILIRPYQALANRSVGYLKGTAEDKVTPYMLQMLNYLKESLGDSRFNVYKQEGRIVIQLLESVRGMDFSDCIVIVDESQLLMPSEVQALVTRVGEESKIIFCGDSNQADNRHKADGLAYLESIIHKYNIPNCSIVSFTKEDCQRSDLVYDFLCAFDEEGWL